MVNPGPLSGWQPASPDQSEIHNRVDTLDLVLTTWTRYDVEFPMIEDLMLILEWVHTGNLLIPNLEKYIADDDRVIALTKFINALNQFIKDNNLEARSRSGDSSAENAEQAGPL